MKNKQKTSGTLEEQQPSEEIPRKQENLRETGNERSKKEQDGHPRTEASTRDMKNRARKSFHNDGPGGNYHGY
ncbi:MAG: hypothetical protein ACXVMS_12105 [Flavisolibacter sp.]